MKLSTENLPELHDFVGEIKQQPRHTFDFRSDVQPQAWEGIAWELKRIMQYDAWKIFKELSIGLGLMQPELLDHIWEETGFQRNRIPEVSSYYDGGEYREGQLLRKIAWEADYRLRPITDSALDAAVDHRFSLEEPSEFRLPAYHLALLSPQRCQELEWPADFGDQLIRNVHENMEKRIGIVAVNTAVALKLLYPNRLNELRLTALDWQYFKHLVDNYSSAQNWPTLSRYLADLAMLAGEVEITETSIRVQPPRQMFRDETTNQNLPDVIKFDQALRD